jgi:hypothetical protein
MKIRPVGDTRFHAGRRADGHDVVTATFCSCFASVPGTVTWFLTLLHLMSLLIPTQQTDYITPKCEETTANSSFERLAQLLLKDRISYRLFTNLNGGTGSGKQPDNLTARSRI